MYVKNNHKLRYLKFLS